MAVYTLFSRTFGSNLHAHRLVNDRGGIVIHTHALIHDNPSPSSSDVRVHMCAGRVGGVVLVLRDIQQIHELREQLKGQSAFNAIVGKNHGMREIYGLIEQGSGFHRFGACSRREWNRKRIGSARNPSAKSAAKSSICNR